MDETEAQVWAVRCMHDTHALAGAMRGKRMNLSTDSKAAA